MTALPSGAAAETTRGVRLPSHLRGPFSTARMQMSAKDWALLRDRDGNRIVKHRLGDVVAIVFGENDEMEEQRAAMLAAAPDLFAAVADVLSHRIEGPTRGYLRDNDASRKALAWLADALSTARAAVAAADRGGRE